MSNILLHSAVFCTTMSSLLLQTVTAQPEQQGEEQGLNRETVEHLLRVVSPSCREEMQEALSEQAELTLECKEEIQSALRERNGNQVPPPGANAPPQVAQVDRDNTSLYVVIFFLMLFVSGLVLFGYWANEQRKKLPKMQQNKKKGKKWLKKQEQKKAKKAQNKQ